MTKLKEDQVYTDIFDIVACYYDQENDDIEEGACYYVMNDEMRNELISSLVEYVLNSRKATNESQLLSKY